MANTFGQKKRGINMQIDNKGHYEMPEEFHDWLNECPVRWQRFRVGDRGIEYVFIYPEGYGSDKEDING